MTVQTTLRDTAQAWWSLTGREVSRDEGQITLVVRNPMGMATSVRMVTVDLTGTRYVA